MRFVHPPAVLLAVLATLATGQPGGGTHAFPALDAAYRKLAGDDSRRRHIVLLTDVQMPAAGMLELARHLRTCGITLTTIALGPSADTVFMQRIADAAGGHALAVGAAGLPAALVADVKRARQ